MKGVTALEWLKVAFGLEGEEASTVPWDVKLRDDPYATIGAVCDEIGYLRMAVASGHRTLETLGQIRICFTGYRETAVVQEMKVEDIHFGKCHRVQ